MSNGITFVHVASESSDDYYLVLPGVPDDEAVRKAVVEGLDFEDPDCLYVEHVERVTHKKYCGMGDKGNQSAL